jgi:hypothetical protein
VKWDRRKNEAVADFVVISGTTMLLSAVDTFGAFLIAVSVLLAHFGVRHDSEKTP